MGFLPLGLGFYCWEKTPGPQQHLQRKHLMKGGNLTVSAVQSTHGEHGAMQADVLELRVQQLSGLTQGQQEVDRLTERYLEYMKPQSPPSE